MRRTHLLISCKHSTADTVLKTPFHLTECRFLLCRNKCTVHWQENVI